MDIKTKYDLGQSVFFIEDNRVKEDIIDSIRIDIKYLGGIRVGRFIYRIGGEPYLEEKLFPTKEELLKSL